LDLGAKDEEINEKTSIALVVEPLYRGRKVTGLEFRFIYKDESKSQQKQFSKKEQFVKYREEVYKTAVGRPIFVYKNRDVVVDKHPKKQKIMVGHKTPNGVEWYSDKEALTVWEILIQNKTAVDTKLWEYHCEDLRF
jgi:plasmid replication initiation protein